ncbi:hypothetical protein ACIP98_20920 [Streptomyces sp. NPDC088354]|uniref:hypothetical protein n=1 Tax=Streptomyces sp. NPDC088354 TaxID=3365856 RepID=UPI0037F6ECE1
MAAAAKKTAAKAPAEETPAPAPAEETPAPAPATESTEPTPDPGDDDAPKADEGSDEPAERPCPQCFPQGWRDTVTAVGCEHGTWTRPAPDA